MKLHWRWSPKSSYPEWAQPNWFLWYPMDGPGFVSLSRIREAIIRMANGEQGWEYNGRYICLMDDRRKQ